MKNLFNVTVSTLSDEALEKMILWAQENCNVAPLTKFRYIEGWQVHYGDLDWRQARKITQKSLYLVSEKMLGDVAVGNVIEVKKVLHYD